MSAREWLDEQMRGLSLMYEFSRDTETMGTAVDAFLEVCRLSGERDEEEKK